MCRRESSALWLMESLLTLCHMQPRAWRDQDTPAAAAEGLSWNVSEILCALVSDARRQPSVCALLAAGFELRLKALTERMPSKFQRTPEFTRMVSSLFACDELLTLQVLSRLGRKLEPSISQRMFPLPNVGHMGMNGSLPGASGSPWTQLALFELCLDMSLFEHATLMLTLACDEVGGADSRESTIESLIMSFELLYQSCRRFSLRVASDTLQFVTRLEALLSCLFDPNGIAWGYANRRPLVASVFRTARVPRHASAMLAPPGAPGGAALGTPPGMAEGGGLMGALSALIGGAVSDDSSSNAGSSSGDGDLAVGMGIYQQALSMYAATPAFSYYVASSLVWSVARTIGALGGGLGLGSSGEDKGATGAGQGQERSREYTSNYVWTVFELLQARLGAGALIDSLFLKRSMSAQLITMVLSDLVQRGKFFNSSALTLVLLGSSCGHAILERVFYAGINMDALSPKEVPPSTPVADEESASNGAAGARGGVDEGASAEELVSLALRALEMNRLTDGQLSARLASCPQAAYWLTHFEREMEPEGGRNACLQAFSLRADTGTHANSSAAAAGVQCFVTLPVPMAAGALPLSALFGGLATTFLLIGRGDACAVLLKLLGFPELAATVCQEDISPAQVTAIVDTLTALCAAALPARPGMEFDSDERAQPVERSPGVLSVVQNACHELGFE